MSHKKYNREQISELERNKYVKSCSEKYITFTDEFKLLCIEQDTLWVSRTEIFEMCGFSKYIVTSEVPLICLKRWRHIVKRSWESWLVWNKKWRPKKERRDVSKMSKDEYIEYLEAKLALSEALSEWNKGRYP